ncbi:MAG: MFS transporter [Candidatus Hodarchaeota archaeon]
MTETDLSFNSSKSLFSLYLASFWVNLGFGIIMPFLPIYASRLSSDIELGLYTIGIGLQMGIITSAFMISRALLAPVYGKMSDSKGRKPIILIGLIAYAFLSVAFGLATGIAELFIVRLLQGIASAAVWPVAESLVVDLSPPERKGKNLGFFMLSMMLGWSLGPFLGSGFIILLETQGITGLLATRITFVSVGIFSVISVLVAHFWVRDPKLGSGQRLTRRELWETLGLALTLSIAAFRPRRPKIYEHFREKDRNLRILYLVALSNGFAFSLVFPIMALFWFDFYGLAEKEIGIILGIAGVLGLLMSPISGWASDRFGRKPVIGVAGTISAFIGFFLGIKWALLIVVGILLVRQMTAMLYMPAFRALQADVISKEVRGAEFGLVQAFFNYGSILGPILGGLIYDATKSYQWSLKVVGSDFTVLGPEILFFLVSIMGLMTILVLLTFIKLEPEVKPLYQAAGEFLEKTGTKPLSSSAKPQRSSTSSFEEFQD